MKELMKEIEIFNNLNRLKILKFLKDKGERPVGDVADNIETSFKTASRQLLYMAKRGILKRRYDGSFVFYKISGNLPKISDSIISHL